MIYKYLSSTRHLGASHRSLLPSLYFQTWLEFRYVDFLFSYAGPGGSVSSLKSKGLGFSVKSLSRSDYEDHGFGWYRVNVELTELGFARVYDVVTAVFCYINTMCRDCDPAPTERWVTMSTDRLIQMILPTQPKTYRTKKILSWAYRFSRRLCTAAANW